MDTEEKPAAEETRLQTDGQSADENDGVSTFTNTTMIRKGAIKEATAKYVGDEFRPYGMFLMHPEPRAISLCGKGRLSSRSAGFNRTHPSPVKRPT